MLKTMTFVIGKLKLASLSLFLDASPTPSLDPRCHFDSEMSLHIYTTYVKGILCQGGEAPKNKLTDAIFNFSMTNVVFLSISCTYAQKDDNTLFDLKSTSILNIAALLLFEK